MNPISGPLATAQESTERKPLIELMSDKFVPDIPFVGYRLTSEPSAFYTTEERNPNAIALADGRLVISTAFQDEVGGYAFSSTVRLTLTNVDRTQFLDYNITMPWDVRDAAMVEMPGGKIGVFGLNPNDLGVWAIVDVTTNIGTVLDSGTFALTSFKIPDLVGGIEVNGRWGTSTVIRRADGKYMVAYVDDPAGDYTAISLKFITSDDFMTWSAPSGISISYLDPTHAIYEPFLFQTVDGKLNILFEYVELFTGHIGTTEQVNIYHYVSSDNGATWNPAPGAGTLGAITNYADFTVTPRHPYAIPLGAGNYRISYHEARSALHMNTTALGWNGTPEAGDDNVVWVHFDEVSRKAYVVNVAVQDLNGIVVVNPDTWSVIKAVTPVSSPTFSDMWWDGGNLRYDGIHGERELVVLMKGNGWAGGNHIAVYNGETDQVTEFHFNAIPMYGISVNTGAIPTGIGSYIGHPTWEMYLTRIFLDYDSRTLYCYWQFPYAFGGVLAVGKIDLSQTGPSYTHDVLFKKDAVPPGTEDGGGPPSEAQMFAIAGTGGIRAGDFKVYPTNGLIVITGGHKAATEGLGGPWHGVTVLYAMDGSRIAFLDSITSDTYPYRGIQKIVKVGDYLYGVFFYEPNYANGERRGLARISLLDFTVTYFRPTWLTLDDYKLRNIIASQDGTELFMSTETYGACAFTIATATWDRFFGDTFPGLFPAEETCFSLAYDSLRESIFLGEYQSGFLIYFYRHGFMTHPMYLTAVDAASWSYGTVAALLTPWTDKDLVMTIDPASAGGMYTFWLHVATDGTTRVRWDHDAAEFNLTDYLVGGSAVVIKRSIDGSPHKLSFSVTHGHLFDPHNVNSLWSVILQKYRRIRVRFGEVVAGTPYWTEAGTFVVISSKMSYQRGTYPTMTVECEDFRVWWEDAEIVATEHYEMAPELILEDVAETWGGLAAGDVVIPALEGSYEVWFQWLDTTVKKVIDILCNRFGYFPTVTVDNKFTCRKISNVNPVDHAYAGTMMIVAFTPDDDFSDFTNRVTVTGETRDFIDVLYEEEAVGTLYGTSGWWGAKQTFTVWYSEDHKRKAKNPRLEVIESCIPNSFIQKLGGGNEYLSSVDADEFFCVVTVEVPDLSGVAWGLGITVLALGIAVGVAGASFFGQTAAWLMFIGWVILLSGLLYILSGIVNWQYQIHARPYGQQRLGCSGQANDVDLQARLNRINERKIDEPLCISTEQCQWLADHELMIVMMQRNRVHFDKIAHLQDEEGDTITIPHPYSGKDMTVFITDLSRSFHIPGETGGEGGFTDSITGWKVAPI